MVDLAGAVQQEQEPEAAPDGDELAGPDDPARERRLAWSDLMRRVCAADVVACPRCGGDMRLVAVNVTRTEVGSGCTFIKSANPGGPLQEKVSSILGVTAVTLHPSVLLRSGRSGSQKSS